MAFSMNILNTLVLCIIRQSLVQVAYDIPGTVLPI